ncbi:MAG: hypothetical protein AB1689_24745 [Thermodesulfobacteriota bacterium]
MNDAALLVRATLALYRDAARDATRALARNLWIIVLLPLYSLVLTLVQTVAAPLGMVGGFLVFLAMAGCVSSFLSLLGEAVAHERIRFGELGATFSRYLWSVTGVLFLFWIIELLLTLITQQNPSLAWLALAVNLGLFLLCNPLPELVYQGTRDGFGLVDEAVGFIRDNAVEWLVPVAVLFAPVFALGLRQGLLAMAHVGATNALGLMDLTLREWLPPMGEVGRVATLIVASLLLTWVMLFRGFLFRSLARSGRRQRIFEARMRGN